MSDEQNFDDLFDNDNENTPEPEAENGPKALRDYAKQLKKEVAELRKFKAEQEAKAREGAVAEKLKAAGLPDGAAKFAASAEDIDAWIEENRGLFGVAAPIDATPADDAKPQGEASLSEEALAEIKAVQRITPGAFTPSDVVATRLVEAQEKATSLDDIVQLTNTALREGNA